MVDNGVYELDVAAYHATKNETSMCDGALSNPAQLVVDSNQAVLKLSLNPVKVGAAEGYLGVVDYYPGWSGSGVPDEDEAVQANVVSSYNGVTDDFNAKKSADAVMKGKKYPKEVELSWDLDADMCFLRVYVPVMNAISEGNGWQFVRLQVDYGSMKRVSGPDDAGSQEGESQEGESQDGGTEKGTQQNPDSAGSQSTETGTSGAEDPQHSDASGDSGSEKETNTSPKSDASSSTGKTDSSGSSKKPGKSSGASKPSKSGNADDAGESDTSGTSGQEDGGTASSESQEPLDFSNLADGSYTVYGQLVKTDRTTPSMADAAIDHAVTLNVTGGAYFLDLRLSQVTFAGQASYLKALSYYRSGYGVDEFGAPTGATSACEVLSYQSDGGQRIADGYGTDYPAEVRIALIPEAKSDGLVPLQAFVPAMESIAAGTGTQSMYLKLDRASVTWAGEGGAVAPSSGSEQQTSMGAETQTGSSSSSGSGGARGGRVLSGNTLPSSAASSSGATVAASQQGAAKPASAGLGSKAAAPSSSTTSQSASSRKAVNVSAIEPVAEGTASEQVAVSRDEPQPPLKNAALPAGVAGGAIVTLGVGSALVRRREWLFDEVL